MRTFLRELAMTTQLILQSRTQTTRTDSETAAEVSSDDTTVIHATVASNVRDTCDQESTVTTRADRKIIKPAHLNDYF